MRKYDFESTLEEIHANQKVLERAQIKNLSITYK